MQGLAVKFFKKIFIQNDILYLLCAFLGSFVLAYILKLTLIGIVHIKTYIRRT